MLQQAQAEVPHGLLHGAPGGAVQGGRPSEEGGRSQECHGGQHRAGKRCASPGFQGFLVPIVASVDSVIVGHLEAVLSKPHEAGPCI